MKKYIVIEGIHGSGKTAVAKGLAEELQKQGINAKYYHFPNEEEKLGQVIRGILTKPNLYTSRQTVGLLYAAASNIFHIQTQDDDVVYILDRHSVTTGLIFQRDIPWETRLAVYKYGIESLQTKGVIVSLDIDQETAKQRWQARNQKLAQKQEAWQDKTQDQFVVEKFQEMANLYQNNFFAELQKLGLPYQKIDNRGDLPTTIKNIITFLSY